MTPRIFAYLSVGMAIFFTFMGVMVMMFPPPMFEKPPYLRFLMGPLLIAYAGFRLARALKILKSPEE